MATIRYDDYIQIQLSWVKRLLMASRTRSDLKIPQAQELRGCAMKAFDRVAHLPVPGPSGGGNAAS